MITIPMIENTAHLTTALSGDFTHALAADNLAAGGTTVSKGVMGESIRYAHDRHISIDFLIRPRGGVAEYTDLELKAMEADIFLAQQLGADGVVFAAMSDHHLDKDALENLVAASGGMTLTFGTALDKQPNEVRTEALRWLSQNGFERVLTRQLDQFETQFKETQKLNLELVPIVTQKAQLINLKKLVDLPYIVDQTRLG